MKKKLLELQKINGVGEVLSRRFLKNGYDTSAKIAAAGEQGLKRVAGLNPKMIQSILAQAGTRVNEVDYGKNEKIENLKQQAESLQVQIQLIALSIRDRFKAEVSDKIQRKLEKDIVKLTASLERVQLKMESKIKKAGKWLLKAEERLVNLTDAKPKEINKGLRKARKSLQRVYA